MFSLGIIEINKEGRFIVTILQNGCKYFLWNKEDVSKNHQNIGLFQYEPQDQFCHWVDVKKIELKKE